MVFANLKAEGKENDRLRDMDYTYFMLTDSHTFKDKKGIEHEWVLIHWRPTIIQNKQIIYHSGHDDADIEIENSVWDELEEINRRAGFISALDDAEFNEDEPYQKFTWPPSWINVDYLNKSDNLDDLIKFARKYSYISAPKLTTEFKSNKINYISKRKQLKQKRKEKQ
jgi:hypothetical protein